jgi:hypothetical protein
VLTNEHRMRAGAPPGARSGTEAAAAAAVAAAAAMDMTDDDERQRVQARVMSGGRMRDENGTE